MRGREGTGAAVPPGQVLVISGRKYKPLALIALHTHLVLTAHKVSHEMGGGRRRRRKELRLEKGWTRGVGAERTGNQIPDHRTAAKWRTFQQRCKQVFRSHAHEGQIIWALFCALQQNPAVSSLWLDWKSPPP